MSKAINRDLAEYLVKHFAKTHEYYVVSVYNFPRDTIIVDQCTFALKVPVTTSLHGVYKLVYSQLLSRYWGSQKIAYLHVYFSLDIGEEAALVERLIAKGCIVVSKIDDIAISIGPAD